MLGYPHNLAGASNGIDDVSGQQTNGQNCKVSELAAGKLAAQTVKVSSQTVKMTSQPVKVVAQPVKVVAQAVKVTAQPVKPGTQAVKLTRKTVKVTAQPVKLISQAVKVHAQTVKLAAQPVTVPGETMTIILPSPPGSVPPNFPRNPTGGPRQLPGAGARPNTNFSAPGFFPVATRHKPATMVAMQIPLTGKQLIAGRWVAAGREFLPAVNPATGETLAPPFAVATSAEVATALNAAAGVFPVTRNLSVARRVELLETIAAQILALGDELLQRAHAETGLPLARLTGERARTCGQFHHFAGVLREGSWTGAVIDTADPQRQPLPKPDVRRVARPLGPVVVFGAGNFPFAYGACGGDTASALAAGNPVVVKAHERHPGVNELFARAVHAALTACGLPLEMFALVHGPGVTVGQQLVQHPATQAVGFTGSQRAGRALFNLAAARPQPIPVFAEMGSLNPLVILPSALAERSAAIAAGLTQSITAGAGQFCTKPGLVFLPAGAAGETFTTQLAEHMAAVPATTMLAAAMQTNFCQTTETFRQIPGVHCRLANSPSGFAAMAPQLFTVAAATWRAHRELHAEAFGPGALVIYYEDHADLLATLAHTEGTLTASLHVGSADAGTEVAALAEQLTQIAGRVVWNGFPTGVEVCAAMVHGGPYPATSAPGTTSVGALAIQRFVRPVCYQNVPDAWLPEELQNANPRRIWRRVNGEWTQAAIG